MKPGTPLADNPDQPAIDAELAKFDAQWHKDHPRDLVQMDRDPVLDVDNPARGATEPREGEQWATPFSFIDKRRRAFQTYRQAKAQFIHFNPIIQEALAREVKAKADRIRDAQAMRMLEVLLVVNAAQKLSLHGVP